MRLVRFEDESGGFAVDLHPLITVISGLPPHVRERLVHGLAALPSGSDPGGRGELEVHGVYLDLNRESLELLELDQDLDVVLRAADLPGADQLGPLVTDDGAPTAADDEVRDARAEVDARDRACADAERLVEALRSQLGAVLAERDQLATDLDRARSGLDSFAVAGLNVAREELAELERRVAGSASAADSDDEPGDHDADPSEVADVAAERERIESRLSFLIEESDRLKRLARSLGSIDPSAVEAAFRSMSELIGVDATDATDAPDEPPVEASVLGESAPEDDGDDPAGDRTAEDDPDEAEELVHAVDELDDVDDVDEADLDEEADGLPAEAAQLIALWEELADREDELAERLSRPDPAVAARDAAREALVAAEEAMRAPRLDPALVEELESTHDEIFELSGRTSKLAAMRSKRKLEALEQRHRQLLEQLGFASWSAYIMGIAGSPTDPAAVEEYERAAAELEDAEERLAIARSSGVRSDPEADELEQLRALLRRRTEDLIGGPYPDDPIVALTQWRPPSTAGELVAAHDEAPVFDDAPFDDAPFEDAPFDDAPVDEEPAWYDRSPSRRDATAEDIEAAAIELWDALAATGARMPDDVMDPLEIHSLAAGWLDTMDTLPDRVDEVVAERDAVEAEIAQLAVEFDALPSDETPPVGRRSARTAPGHAWDGTTPPTAAELDSARARVAEIEARAAAHQRAAGEVERIEARQTEAVAQARDLNLQLGAREPQLAALREQRVVARNRLRRAEAARDAEDAARRDQRARAVADAALRGAASAEAVEWYVLARLAQQRSVSFVGSVPLVIDDAFANWPVDALGEVFSRLERMGEVIQIVYLTESPEVGDWARGLGPDRALVLDMRVSA